MWGAVLVSGQGPPPGVCLSQSCPLPEPQLTGCPRPLLCRGIRPRLECSGNRNHDTEVKHFRRDERGPVPPEDGCRAVGSVWGGHTCGVKTVSAPRPPRCCSRTEEKSGEGVVLTEHVTLRFRCVYNWDKGPTKAQRACQGGAWRGTLARSLARPAGRAAWEGAGLRIPLRFGVSGGGGSQQDQSPPRCSQAVTKPAVARGLRPRAGLSVGSPQDAPRMMCPTGPVCWMSPGDQPKMDSVLSCHL